jgi:hypothetical protein
MGGWFQWVGGGGEFGASRKQHKDKSQQVSKHKIIIEQNTKLVC